MALIILPHRPIDTIDNSYIQARSATSVLDPECFTDVIARCCELKAHIVIDDEREESGYRAILLPPEEDICGLSSVPHASTLADTLCTATVPGCPSCPHLEFRLQAVSLYQPDIALRLSDERFLSDIVYPLIQF